MHYVAEGMPTVVDPYRERNGIFVPPDPVAHREDVYDSQGFELLAAMQHQHFWYTGRHRFLLHAVERHLSPRAIANPPRVIDLGGGCGGWLAYLLARKKGAIAEAALADSSEKALQLAARCLPAGVARYHIDLLDLQWKSRWDAAFLLDVLEHLPEERTALEQIREALAPGGKLFITTPALQFFWTWNDDVVGHQRRYARADFRRLAEDCGFRLLQVRYFMFFLSPLLLASRFVGARAAAAQTQEDRWRLVQKMHQVPHPIVNGFLAAVFACETPLGHWLPFPWGTSVLAVLERA
jgi:2-polyprenyl-3-methyl-5-hydroxy-6-metoxy-1,4-benzoquinol methylase